ncbi:hypothetical protein SDC9_145120 [bioreactor metagenome]|uniref:Uncharacterized protein n=1 Tax=bioreactor metagenome TaxID=1076179 RepID=A0A645E953_9ZZZZ
MNEHFYIIPNSVQSILIRHTRFQQLFSERCDTILVLPGFHFFFRTIGGGIRRRVPAVPISQDVQQYRPVFLFNHFAFAFVSINDRQRIVTVHTFGVHLFFVHTRTNTGCNTVAHGFAAGLATHPVLIVHDVDNHRKATFHISLPEFFELIHGRKRNSFPNGSACHRSITYIGNHQSGFAVDLFVQRGTHGNISRTAHDGIVGIYSERGEKGMHRTAKPPVKSGFPGKYFCQCSINQKTAGKLLSGSVKIFLNDFQHRTIEKALHYFHQFAVGKLMDGRHPFGKDLTV